MFTRTSLIKSHNRHRVKSVIQWNMLAFQWCIFFFHVKITMLFAMLSVVCAAYLFIWQFYWRKLTLSLTLDFVRYVNIHCTSSIDTASECQTMLAFYMQTLFNCLLNDVKHSLNFHEVSLKKVIFSVRQYNSYHRKSYFI